MSDKVDIEYLNLLKNKNIVSNIIPPSNNIFIIYNRKNGYLGKLPFNSNEDLEKECKTGDIYYYISNNNIEIYKVKKSKLYILDIVGDIYYIIKNSANNKEDFLKKRKTMLPIQYYKFNQEGIITNIKKKRRKNKIIKKKKK